MADSTVNALPKSIHKHTCKLMGNIFNFSIVHHEAKWAARCLKLLVDEIQRIESLLTTYRDDSQTNQINRGAGKYPVKVDNEVFDLIKRSIKISELTQGAFDITYGSIDKSLWNFDKGMTSLPDAQLAKRTVDLIDYRNILLDDEECSVYLRKEGMRIGFGGIGKGYAADRGKRLLLDLGVESGVVNAAGDLTAWGKQMDGRPWTVGVADPESKMPFTALPLQDMAIATSGNYEKFITINGKKYSHTIDPKTGLPVTGIASVSIISPTAELSDALATPVMVMGIKAGLDMINQMKGVACLIIDEKNQLFTSNNNISIHNRS